MRALTVWLGVAGAAACSVPELALEGKECPCGTGFVCDEPRQVCVRGGESGDAGLVLMDAGLTRVRDAGRPSEPDAGPAPASVDAGNANPGAPPSTVCASPGAIYCAGFEDDFSGLERLGDPAIDTATAVEGVASMRGELGSIASARIPQPSDQYAVRFFFYREPGFESGQLALLSLGTGVDDPNGLAIGIAADGRPRVRFGSRVANVETDLGEDEVWYCVAVVIDRRFGNFEISTSVGAGRSVLPPFAEAVNTIVMGPHRLFGAGSEGDHPAYRIDDVVVANAPLDCRP